MKALSHVLVSYLIAHTILDAQIKDMATRPDPCILHRSGPISICIFLPGLQG
jgi:hypothetical protein